MTNITVGPVIGKVTANSIRVLIEVNENKNVECVVTSDDGHIERSVLQFQRNIPKAFQMINLRPNTKYQITFNGADTDLNSIIRTFPDNTTKLTVGVVSCNFVARRGSKDLWQDMYDRYIAPEKLDLILHIGDQIYADTVFEAAQHRRRKLGNTRRFRKKTLEDYRHLYCVSWNHPATRKVLANVSNLMIWDDHEIRDDWGSIESHYDKRSTDYQIGSLARQVFREYQRQLWDDLPEQPADGYEYHLHKWGGIGVLCLDLRGGRTFERGVQRPFLGIRQWEDISQALQDGGYFDDVHALIVTSSVPLVYFSPLITTIGGRRIEATNDLIDHWSYGTHITEQIEMIRALRRWKANGNGNREVLVVGGDVHIGGHTDIKHRGQTVFKQLITSPITNSPPTWMQYYGLRLTLESLQQLGHNYSFEHHNFTNKRNYGIVVARVTLPNRITLYGELVQET